MELRQIEYIIKIAEAGGITKASEQLFITQSALNQQLLKLESELGVQLFHRRRNKFTPTDAGEVYIKYGREILQKKQEAYNIINDLATNNLGHLSLAFSPERGIDMFVSTYPAFHEHFPKIIIEPQEMRVRLQLQQLAKGYVDLGLVTLTDADKLPELEFEHIRYEPLLLAISRKSPFAKNAALPDATIDELPYMDLAKLKKAVFVLMFKNSTLRNIIDVSFKKAGYIPNVIFETASNRTLVAMAKNNIACTITSAEYYWCRDDIAFYRIPNKPRWEVCTVYKKGSYRSQAALYYNSLIKDYFINTAPLLVKNKSLLNQDESKKERHTKKKL